MESCSQACRRKKSVLCKHRFEFEPKIVYCHGESFQEWPDSEVLIFFLALIRGNLTIGKISRRTPCVIVTRDKDFLADARKELGDNPAGFRKFGRNFVETNDGVTIFIYTLNIKTPGDSGRNVLSAIAKGLNAFKERRRRRIP